MIRRILAAVGLAVLLAGPAPASAQSKAAFTPEQRDEIVSIMRDALQRDPSILRDAITALQADESAREQTAAQAAIARDAPALKDAHGDPEAGNPKGDVTVVEFYDLRCPYCRRMLSVDDETLKQEPNVRLVFKDIPVLGPSSVLGAKAVLAAERQGGYLKLRHAIMSGTPNITEDSLREAAGEAGLNWQKLRHDMDDPDIQARISANLNLAHDLGVHGTPAYVVGEQLIPGATDVNGLRAAIAAARGG